VGDRAGYCTKLRVTGWAATVYCHKGSIGPFQESLFARQKRTVTRMADPPNKTDSVAVDELLGMAHDAYARARASPDASTKEKLTRLADGYLKQAKDMRRGYADRFSKT
jgi:hypothetical protein